MSEDVCAAKDCDAKVPDSLIVCWKHFKEIVRAVNAKFIQKGDLTVKQADEIERDLFGGEKK